MELESNTRFIYAACMPYTHVLRVISYSIFGAPAFLLTCHLEWAVELSA
jgi:hypothetical protein